MLTDLTVFVLPLDVSCSVLTDNRLLPNVYSIKIGIDPIEGAVENIGIGFQRIKLLSEYYLQGAIFAEKDHEITKEFDKLDSNVVHLPSEPYDVYVGAALLAKFQTITANYFDIQYLSISSMLGDNIQYNIIDPAESDLELQGDHWWNQDNVYTGSKDIVSWDELNLTEVPKFRPTVIKGGLSEN
jgi:hypothetical protein